MTPRGLHVSKDLTLPVDVAGEALALLAKRGAGKTNTGIVLAEEMHKARIQFVVLDPVGAWWGLRSKLDVPIIGGLHGDLELSPTAGALLADVLIESGQSMVLDTSGFATKAEVARFVRDFLDHLYRRLGQQPRLIHVFLEEADEFAPQKPFKEETRMLSAVEQVVRRGRGRGMGITLITQRSAVLNKNVLEQADILVAMRTTGPNDRKAIQGWVGLHTEGDEEGVVESLPSLADGEAWIWNPERDLLKRAQIRMRDTIDVAGRIRAGEKRVDVALKPIDLTKLGAEIEATAEKQRENDPAELRKRIRALENEVAKKPKVDPGFVAWANDRIHELEARETETVEVPAISDADIRVLRNEAQDLIAEGAELRKHADYIDEAVKPILEGLDKITGARAPVTAEDARPPTRPHPSSRAGGAPARDARRREPAPSAAPPSLDGENVKAGARRIVETLARHHPMKVTRSQLGTLAKFKITGGTFQTYFSQLKRLGLIQEIGDEISVTEAGLEFVGVVHQEPMTPDEVVDMWRGSLKAGARRMLDEVLTVGRDGEMTKEELAERLDMAVTGGTFQTYLSTLRRNGLVLVESNYVYPSDALFLGVAA